MWHSESALKVRNTPNSVLGTQKSHTVATQGFAVNTLVNRPHLSACELSLYSIKDLMIRCTAYSRPLVKPHGTLENQV